MLYKKPFLWYNPAILNLISHQGGYMNQEKKRNSLNWRQKEKKEQRIKNETEELEREQEDTKASRKEKEKKKQKPTAQSSGKFRH